MMLYGRPFPVLSCAVKLFSDMEKPWLTTRVATPVNESIVRGKPVHDFERPLGSTSLRTRRRDPSEVE